MIRGGRSQQPGKETVLMARSVTSDSRMLKMREASCVLCHIFTPTSGPSGRMKGGNLQRTPLHGWSATPHGPHCALLNTKKTAQTGVGLRRTWPSFLRERAKTMGMQASSAWVRMEERRSSRPPSLSICSMLGATTTVQALRSRTALATSLTIQANEKV